MVTNVSAGEQRVAATEANAARIVSWEPLILPGLLQEPGYTTALLSRLPSPIRPSNEAIAAVVDFRAGRQRTIFQLRPTAGCHFVIHEGALLALIAHPDRPLAQRQLRRLLDAAMAGVSIQVATSSRGILPWPAGPFYIVHQLDGSRLLVLERLADQDSAFSTAAAVIDSYENEWQLLTATALSAADSLHLMNQLLLGIS